MNSKAKKLVGVTIGVGTAALAYMGIRNPELFSFNQNSVQCLIFMKKFNISTYNKNVLVLKPNFCLQFYFELI